MKDEIASRIYVNLSRDEKRHDSCAEYNSMLHDMVHGRMLYDTVDFVLNRGDILEIGLLAEVSPYLMNRSDCISSDSLPYVHGRYKGYNMYVNTRTLRINACSLCEYYYSTSMHDFPLEDIRKAIGRIGEDLNIPMGKITVTRMDPAIDLELQRPPIEYFSWMLDLPYFRHLSYPAGITFQAAEKELSFYGKGKEQGNSNKNIARCEFRIKKVRKCLGKSVTASMLYDPSFWNDLLDRFLSCYSKVKVGKKSLPLDKIDGVRSLLSSTLRESANRNGFDPLRSGFKARVRDGKLTQRAYKSTIERIRRYCFSSRGKDVGPEMEEFDVKFRSFLELKRFD